MAEACSSFRIRPSARLTLRLRGCLLASLAFAALLSLPAPAGEADVVEVGAACTAESVCDFRVRVRHADEGWEHYANRWEVLSPEGEVLATRVLHHPHVDEQPFTRSLRGVRVPPHVKRVRIRAGDSVHDFGGREQTVVLERRGGQVDRTHEPSHDDDMRTP